MTKTQNKRKTLSKISANSSEVIEISLVAEKAVMKRILWNRQVFILE